MIKIKLISVPQSSFSTPFIRVLSVGSVRFYYKWIAWYIREDSVQNFMYYNKVRKSAEEGWFRQICVFGLSIGWQVKSPSLS